MPRFFNFYSLLYFYSAFYTIINEIRAYPPLISTFKFSVTLPTHISYQFHVFFVIVVNALNLNCPVNMHMDVGPFTGIYGTYYWLHPQVIVLIFPVAINCLYHLSNGGAWKLPSPFMLECGLVNSTILGHTPT